METVKTPMLKPIDLSRCCKVPGNGSFHDHPDIDEAKQYLVKIGKYWYAGYFSRQWYGWSFMNWGTSGRQLDKPGTNASDWEAIFELVENQPALFGDVLNETKLKLLDLHPDVASVPGFDQKKQYLAEIKGKCPNSAQNRRGKNELRH